ncbi:hypothetical protein Hanom_Chr16g01517561 [Helianthus anomalus]
MEVSGELVEEVTLIKRRRRSNGGKRIFRRGGWVDVRKSFIFVSIFWARDGDGEKMRYL